ncbi:ATP-binding protein [Marinomonas primoryensis]|jgi:DNA replication protein DnaC|tara:strand:- start:134 stop:262 length:129 start_codon:yes stop_codon:yes gene_type:complete
MAVTGIDRLVHHTYIIQLTGESYRRKTAMKEEKKMVATGQDS